MEKTRQQEINDIVSEALMGLKEAHEYGGKSRELLLKLLQFEGNRIDSLENKIDLLMTERAEVIAMRNQIKDSRAYANQRVIEELERLKSDCDAEDDAYSFAMSKAHQKRIKELKQD